MSDEKLFSHSSPVWPVKNMQRSLDYYVNELGFEVLFKWEDPPTYATIKRDDIGIHLTTLDDLEDDYRPRTALFIFVYDVDAVWAEYQEKEVKIVAEIGDREYGMRDFDIEDPDGYRLVFGKSLSID